MRVQVVRTAPTVVSMFAGCGGSSLGYRMAGYRELLAVEWDPVATAAFRANFPGVLVHEGDIAELSGGECLCLAGIAPGELDVLDGSPPCQGFSTAGKRRLKDPRNTLFREFARLLGELKPKAFVMENVSGLVKGYMKQVYLEAVKSLRDCGYRAKGEVMNAAHFGVPQRRERVIVVGVREDLGAEPSHPKPCLRGKTFREACIDLRGNSPDDRMLPGWLRDLGKTQPNQWTTELEGYKRVKGTVNGAISTRWAGWNRVCGTITRSEIAWCGIIHPDRERYISLPEAKRLTGFPDDFKLPGRKLGIGLVGNSVPPPLMRAIALHVREEILSVPTRAA